MKNSLKKLNRGKKIAFIATISTLLLAAMKGLVGYLFDSKLLIADAFHSSADTVAIFASGFGLWLAARKKSNRFPYGLYKAETLGTFLVGGFIVWAGVEFLVDGYKKLLTTEEVIKFPYLPIGVALLSVIAAFFIAKKEKSVGEEIGSQSLIANGKESFLDIISSLVVLLGLVLAYLKIPFIEGSIIIFISLLILKLGIENIWRSVLTLMDANLDREVQAKIEEITQNVYGVEQINDIKIRESGPFKMVEVVFTTNPLLPVFRAHELADEVESKIIRECENIESVFVHVEPSKRKVISAICPVEDIHGLQSTVSKHFGRAPYFIFLKIEKDKVEIEDFYLNEFLQKSRYIGLNVVKILADYGIDILFTPQIGEISFYMLKDKFIDIYKVTEPKLTVADVLDRYRRNQLQRIISPTRTIDESEIEKE